MSPSQKQHLFRIATTRGLEALAADEARAAGLTPIGSEPGAVSAKGSLPAGLRLCLQGRTIGRVWLTLTQYRARHWDALTSGLSGLPWGRFLPSGCTVAVRAGSLRSRLYHEGGIVERVAERLAQKGHSAAAWGEADQRLLVAVVEDEVSVRIDLPGEHLARRGWRVDPGVAPLRPDRAAACLIAAGYRGGEPLQLPFCGSGTLAVEGGWIAAKRAPGLTRPMAFTLWPEVSQRPWRKMLDQAQARIQTSSARIVAWDLDEAALARSRANLEAAGVKDTVDLVRGDIGKIPFDPALAPGLLLANPPYGERLGRDFPQRWWRPWTEAGWRVALLRPSAAAPPEGGARALLNFDHGGLPTTLWKIGV